MLLSEHEQVTLDDQYQSILCNSLRTWGSWLPPPNSVNNIDRAAHVWSIHWHNWKKNILSVSFSQDFIKHLWSHLKSKLLLTMNHRDLYLDWKSHNGDCTWIHPWDHKTWLSVTWTCMLWYSYFSCTHFIIIQYRLWYDIDIYWPHRKQVFSLKHSCRENTNFMQRDWTSLLRAYRIVTFMWLWTAFLFYYLNQVPLDIVMIF